MKFQVSLQAEVELKAFIADATLEFTLAGVDLSVAHERSFFFVAFATNLTAKRSFVHVIYLVRYEQLVVCESFFAILAFEWVRVHLQMPPKALFVPERFATNFAHKFELFGVNAFVVC